MTDCTQVSHFWWVPNVVLAHEKDGIEALRLVNLVAQSTKVSNIPPVAESLIIICYVLWMFFVFLAPYS